MKAFPIPVTMIGPGSQPEEETLSYMAMPQGMQSFRSPVLPEPEAVAVCEAAHRVLRATLAALAQVAVDGVNRRVDLVGLPPADLALVNQVLGEGEVSALVKTVGDPVHGVAAGVPEAASQGGDHELRVQESVYAGVWRVIRSAGGRTLSDHIELGAVPTALYAAARDDVWPEPPRWQGALPPNVQNAPLLLAEIEDQWRTWAPGRQAHVVNLTLLPMSQEDIGFLDHHLGTGRVLILSRGYGNCRITNTCMPHCWRVVYYNSQDLVILNTVEVVDLPEVALAAREDLADSHERLQEVLAWVEGMEGMETVTETEPAWETGPTAPARGAA